MPAACSFPAACALRGKAYVVEGAAHSPAVLSYDRRAQRWSRAPKPDTPRVNMAMSALSDQIYILGGREGTGKAGVSLSSVEHLTPGEAPERWRPAPAMTAARSALGAAALLGKLYCVGGQSDRATHATLEFFDPGAGRWVVGSEPMRQARKYLAVAAAAGQLLAVGGMSVERQRLANVEAFDPREGRWRALPPLSVARSSCGAAVLHGEVYVVGGSVGAGDAHCGVECFSPAAGRWRRCAPLHAARSCLAVVPV
jgi:hypothetical protein